ncbi:hypothetical protein N7520_002196 [Penicillium odoratum]|uniref:uncharacterized protein n=1 Tax=Penicillium odoratum TaxID=1167516 RepID=UPI0025490D62|nr:uncharacterized protein N7520_002196 [Penicillium odoratum]KAJ5771667.1 hypothetical protein N7520_002196 [Penicillium odoratum]
MARFFQQFDPDNSDFINVTLIWQTLIDFCEGQSYQRRGPRYPLPISGLFLFRLCSTDYQRYALRLPGTIHGHQIVSH